MCNQEEKKDWDDETFLDYQFITHFLIKESILETTEEINVQHITCYLSYNDLEIPIEYDIGILESDISQWSFSMRYNHLDIGFTIDPNLMICNQKPNVIKDMWTMLKTVDEMINSNKDFSHLLYKDRRNNY